MKAVDVLGFIEIRKRPLSNVRRLIATVRQYSGDKQGSGINASVTGARV